MKTCTKCGVEKSRGEFHKNSLGKDGLQAWCRVCCNARSSQWRANNPEKVKANKAVWDSSHGGETKAYTAAWYAANQERARGKTAAWKRANPDKHAANETARRARKLQAMPGWADKGFIDLWYTGAKTMTQLAGKPYHVDHIVPLKSKLVCGLHVPANMQILPRTDNSAKGNRYWPDMP